MARRRKKRVAYQQWIPVTFDVCPKCDGTPEILTYSKRDELFYNLDPVRCAAQCGTYGEFKINSTGLKGLIEWDLDPFNLEAQTIDA